MGRILSTSILFNVLLIFTWLSYGLRANPCLRINGTRLVRVGVDDLEIMCFPTDGFQKILGYVLHKTSTFSTSNITIVRIVYLVHQKVVDITWMDHSVEERGGRVKYGLLNSGKAWMKFIIPKDKVKCSIDTARYHCTTFGSLPTPTIDKESFLEIRIEGVNMTQIIDSGGHAEKSPWTFAIPGIVVVLVTIPLLTLTIFRHKCSTGAPKQMKDLTSATQKRNCKFSYHEYEGLEKYQLEIEDHYEDC